MLFISFSKSISSHLWWSTASTSHFRILIWLRIFNSLIYGKYSASGLKYFILFFLYYKYTSIADASAFLLTSVGSQTNVSYVSHNPDEPLTSTPNHFPSCPPYECFALSLFITSIEFKPAFSAIVRGITSNDFANALKTYYAFPVTVRAWCFMYLDNSSSIAPPPATILFAL